jgi:hypothetical protein
MQTLQIKLEDMAGTSWWAGVLATLASQPGNAYVRFVAASTAIATTKGPRSPRREPSARYRPGRREHQG